MSTNYQLIKAIVRSIFLILMITFAGYLFQHYNLHIYLTNTEKGIRFINSFRPYSEIVFIFFQIIQVLFAPIPGEATGFMGGFIFGAFPGAIYSTIGLSLGSWAAFILARIFGKPLVERIIKTKTIDRYNYFIEQRGTYISFILFLIPGFPKDMLCYILGLSRMNLGEFMIVSSLGRLLGTILLSAIGASLRSEKIIVFFILLILGGLMFIWGIFHSKAIMNKLHRKKTRNDDKQNTAMS